mmetsp:Transcript_7392/g.15840  ORF Transcript_7392/g.15840 Transcript_7392/m.15840 type:complete len:203 (+) Transcript_7392:208-816(+)
MVSGGLHAIDLQGLQRSSISGLILLGRRQIPLGRGQRLLVRSQSLLGIVQLLVLLLASLRQRRLHHLVIELGLSLGLGSITSLPLSLGHHVLKHFNDGLDPVVAHTGRLLLLCLQKRLDAGGIMGGEHGAINQGGQRAHQLAHGHAVQLHEACCRLLEHRDRPGQGIDCLRQRLVGLRPVLALRSAQFSRLLQLRLILSNGG